MIVSDIEVLAAQVARGELVEVEAPGGTVYRLEPRPAGVPPIYLSWRHESGNFYSVNDHTWGINWEPRNRPPAAAMQASLAVQAARTVLAAIFAGRDVYALECDQEITSLNSNETIGED